MIDSMRYLEFEEGDIVLREVFSFSDIELNSTKWIEENIAEKHQYSSGSEK